MLITKTYHDLPTKLHENGSPIRIFIMSPLVQDYPYAKFPGFAHSLLDISQILTSSYKALWSLGTSLQPV